MTRIFPIPQLSVALHAYILSNTILLLKARMSGNKRVIDEDLVKVYSSTKEHKLLTTLAWGDEVQLLEEEGGEREFNTIETEYYVDLPDGGFKKLVGSGLIKKKTKLLYPEEIRILKVSFVDVQQGDGTIIETPNGHLILIDGGDNALFARYLAQKFVGSSIEKPLEIDAIVITHGDADHFAGLTEIYKSEIHGTKRKRLFIHPHRILHNGIVKGPSVLPVREIFGNTEEFDDRLYLTELHDNLLEVDKSKLNRPFKEWVEAIRAWEKRVQQQDRILIKRLQYGDDKLFSFLDGENIRVRVLAPLVKSVNGKPALPFLYEPPKTPPVELKEEAMSPELNIAKRNKKNYSASHTINGHSVVLQLQYGKIRFLFTGDLNQESEIILQQLAENNRIDITSEIFKVPHHGSADFEPGFLDLVSPAVSIVSSGDESARKEYIHPRSTLVGSLGKHSRLQKPLIFITELVSFFEMVGNSIPVATKKTGNEKLKEFFAFKRAQFGIVHVRTDGKRILVFTHSGRRDMKEAYALTVGENNEVKFDTVRM